MADSEPKVRWHRILAVLVTIAVLVEVVAQAYTWAWAGQPYRSFAKYRWSPYGLVRNNPELSMPGYRINRNGFRNLEDFTQAKPPRTLRVLLIGGSVLYAGLGGEVLRHGERVDSDTTIAQFLAEELRRDPALAGIRIEVLNAAVNYSRINEVATGYLAEYAAWDPDIVIVFGSANNFPKAMKRGDLAARRLGVSLDHPWAREFERIANRQTVFTLLEHVELFLEHELASVAWARKVVEPVVDRAFALTATRAFDRPRNPTTTPYADWAEYDAYVDEYLSFADALVATARRRHQDVAFFWEYFLVHTDGLKRLTPDEAELSARIARPSDAVDRDFNFHARDRVAAQLGALGVPMIDPRPALAAETGTMFIDFVHYTAHGNQVMAHAVYENLRELFHRRGAAVR